MYNAATNNNNEGINAVVNTFKSSLNVVFQTISKRQNKPQVCCSVK